MQRALSIARYCINYVNQNDCTVTHLKLQKILYYIQAAFLVEKGEPCFPEEILALQKVGPYVPIVYNTFSCYAPNPISPQIMVPTLVFKNGFMSMPMRPFAINLEKSDKVLIDNVLDGLMRYDEWFLVSKTLEESPCANLVSDRPCIVSLDSMRAYFMDGHERRIYGHFEEAVKPSRRREQNIELINLLLEERSPVECAKVIGALPNNWEEYPKDELIAAYSTAKSLICKEAYKDKLKEE